MSASAPAGSPDATTAPTPQATLYGDFPGPAASIPPGQPVIANLTFGEIADLWRSLGMSCFSHASGGPESPAAFNVHCEGGDPAADVEATSEANYWTFNAVAMMDVRVGPISDASIDAAATAQDWVVPFAKLAGGEDAVSWLLGHVNDPACRLGCIMEIGASDLAYYSGTRGGHGLHYVVRIPVR